jgi:hypothetical protein
MQIEDALNEPHLSPVQLLNKETTPTRGGFVLETWLFKYIHMLAYEGDTVLMWKLSVLREFVMARLELLEMSLPNFPKLSIFYYNI